MKRLKREPENKLPNQFDPEKIQESLPQGKLGQIKEEIPILDGVIESNNTLNLAQTRRERRLPKNPASGSVLDQISDQLDREEVQDKINLKIKPERDQVPKDNTLEKYKKLGIYSLSDASEKRDLEALKFFLIYIEEIYYGTPLEEWLRALYEAVKNRYIDIIDQLLVEDVKGDFIFSKYRCSFSNLSTIHYYYLYIDDECYPYELHKASEQGYFEIVKRLVEHNNICKIEYSKHLDSLYSSSKDKLIYLYQYSCEHINEEQYINLEDTTGNTAISLAVLNNHLDIVTYLIKKQAKLVVTERLYKDYPYSYDSYSLSLLHKTYKKISLEILSLLLKYGLNINDRDYKGRTVLHKACIDNDLKSFNLLISSGALLSLKDNDDKTPLDYAGDEIKKHLI